MRSIIVILALAIIPLISVGQGRKDIRAAGIKSVTVYKSDYKTGTEKKTKESVTTYDGNGNETEIIEYDEFGKITRHDKYTYDANNNRISQTEYDAAGKVKESFKYTYNSNNDKITETEYDAAGKLKKTFKYFYFENFKTEKQVYDAANKLTSKKTYTYAK